MSLPEKKQQYYSDEFDEDAFRDEMAAIAKREAARYAKDLAEGKYDDMIKWHTEQAAWMAQPALRLAAKTRAVCRSRHIGRKECQ